MKCFAAVAAGVILAAPEIEISVLRDRLDKYLIAYEPQLSQLVADEELFQNDGYRKRTMISEVAFVGLPADAGWMGFRQVLKVGGKSVKDAGPSLGQVLSNGLRDDYSQARLLLAQSAQHNLGAPRTINLPNLPLELLHPRHRHRFTHRFEGYENVSRHRTARFIAEENSKPSLIRNPQGDDFSSVITVWIEPETGRLWRAQVRSRDTAIIVGNVFETSIRVEFREDAKLGLLVPWEMREFFFVERRHGGTGIAKYTNYRRFQTAARVVPQ